MPVSPQYISVLPNFSMKYFQWDENFKPVLLDDNQVISVLNEFQNTASAELNRYFKMDLEAITFSGHRYSLLDIQVLLM